MPIEALRVNNDVVLDWILSRSVQRGVVLKLLGVVIGPFVSAISLSVLL